MKKPRERGFVKNLTGPLGYPHAWVEAIAGGVSARLAPFRSYADAYDYSKLLTILSPEAAMLTLLAVAGLVFHVSETFALIERDLENC